MLRPPVYAPLYNLKSDNVVVSLNYNTIMSTLNSYKNKVIIYSSQELVSDEELWLTLSKNVNNNFYIFLHILEPPLDLQKKYKDNFQFIKIKNTYGYYSLSMNYQNIDFDKIKNTEKTRHFLSLNNRATWFRQGLFYFIENFSLQDKFYFSYIGDHRRTQYQSLSDIDRDFIAPNNDHVWYTKNKIGRAHV
mgnify:CR=1 FL=1